MSAAKSIAVIGLGYVGLPLALALARRFSVVGIDISVERIAELERGFDRTNEIDTDALVNSTIRLTTDADAAKGADIFIVTVPTPVDSDNVPDLGPVLGATRTVARLIEPGSRAIVVYESTVYPGVTEDVCGPLLEAGGLRRGEDFLLGYSPERINPGDQEHTVDKITKVIAGENDAVTDVLAEVYGSITSGGVFRAQSIKAAEAAKVIENAQRDINIAFMNEIAQIFARLDVSVWDVLAAARTKWNFLPFQPGLVGGHCIGVDPYYLSHRAQELGFEPNVILAGRAINDGMERWVADQLHAAVGKVGSVLVMGLAFKENVPDLRNSRVANLVGRLAELGHCVTVHDPLVLPSDATEEYGITLTPDALQHAYDIVFVAVPHAVFADLGDDQLVALVRHGGLFADLKDMFRDRALSGVRRWTL